jgi:hypothetical protein
VCVPADKRHLQTMCVGTSVGLCRLLAPSCQGRLPLVDGDAEDKRIARVGYLSCRCLRHIGGKAAFSKTEQRANERNVRQSIRDPVSIHRRIAGAAARCGTGRPPAHPATRGFCSTRRLRLQRAD